MYYNMRRVPFKINYNMRNNRRVPFKIFEVEFFWNILGRATSLLTSLKE